MPETQKLTLHLADLARANDDFRQVLWTGENTQLVLMAIPEGGDIGGEVHKDHDQLLYFVVGTGTAKIGEVECAIAAGDIAIVPAGVRHNFRNTGSGMLKLFTTYSPPEHDPGTEHATKSEADADG